jgi:hypothetical protein
MVSADVNTTFLNEQDSRICPLHLTVFATNNHYLIKVFQSLYQYFKYCDCCMIKEIAILMAVIYQRVWWDVFAG